MDSSSDVYLLYDGIKVTARDINQLKNPVQLDDDVIQFYLQFLDYEVFKSPAIYTVPASLSPLLKTDCDPRVLLSNEIDSKQLVFIPVNDYEAGDDLEIYNEDKVRGRHWSLLVFSRPDKAFFSFDSAGKFNQEATEKLFEKLKTALSSTEPPMYLTAVSVQQPNEVDCALYMLANIEHLGVYFQHHGTLRNAPIVAREVAAGFRQKVLGIIEELAKKSGRTSDKTQPKMQKSKPPVFVLTKLLFFREELSRESGNVIEIEIDSNLNYIHLVSNPATDCHNKSLRQFN